ncbi:nucleoside deaminase [Rhodococcus hoagii]|nr:nucleoside deaminase [Prescottella equi]
MTSSSAPSTSPARTSRRAAAAFAAVIVKDGEVLAESPNRVAQTGDPTASRRDPSHPPGLHRTGHEHLTGTTIYVLAHPCPMCLARSTTARPTRSSSSPPATRTSPTTSRPQVLRTRHLLRRVRQPCRIAGCPCATRSVPTPSTCIARGRPATPADPGASRTTSS